MEIVQLLPSNFTSYILFFSFIFSILTLWKKFQSSEKRIKLPPGPPTLPFIGNLHQLLGTPLHRVARDMAKQYGPLMHLKLGQVSTYVVSSRELAKEVLKTQDPAIADRPPSLGSDITGYNGLSIVFGPYGEYWRQMRKVCTVELLSLKHVRSFDYIRKDEASRLVEYLRSNSGKPVNLTERVFGFTSSSICRAAFGKAVHGREDLIDMLKKGVASAGGFDISDLFPSLRIFNVINTNKYKLLKMQKKMDSILDAQLNEHRNNKENGGDFGAEDLVDAFLRVQRTEEFGFPISDTSIKAVLFDMFSAGTESSSTTLEWAMAEMLRRPSVLEKSQAKLRAGFKGKDMLPSDDIEAGAEAIRYVKLIIKEVLRMHPPVALLPRASRVELKVDGYTIPPKCKVLINGWALGRDPNYWDEPEIFNPDRFEKVSLDFLGADFEYLPFGAGKRFCPGMSFGLAGLEVVLTHLLYHFDWKLPNGMKPEELDMADAQGIAIGRKHNLYVIPTPYIK